VEEGKIEKKKRGVHKRPRHQGECLTLSLLKAPPSAKEKTLRGEKEKWTRGPKKQMGGGAAKERGGASSLRIVPEPNASRSASRVKDTAQPLGETRRG